MTFEPRRHVVKRVLIPAIGLAFVVAALAGCGGSGKPSASEQLMQQEATMWQISQIEVNFHRATSTHNLNLMMSLWAPGAVFNIDQQTLTGKAQIRNWFATQSAAFQPENHWESDTPSYKEKIAVNGDKATLYFECHYIDPKTAKVMSYIAVTHQLQKIGGKWLIVNSAAQKAVLSANP
jgi:ketosteroid isomerase-like protein